MPLYTFNKDALEYEKINFKPLIMTIIFVSLFSLFARWLYFDAELIKTTDWRGKEIKITIEQHLKQQKQEQIYDTEAKAFIQQRTNVNGR